MRDGNSTEMYFGCLAYNMSAIESGEKDLGYTRAPSVCGVRGVEKQPVKLYNHADIH